MTSPEIPLAEQPRVQNFPVETFQYLQDHIHMLLTKLMKSAVKLAEADDQTPGEFTVQPEHIDEAIDQAGELRAFLKT